MRRERISLALLVFLKTCCIHFILGDQTTHFLWFKTQPCDATAGEKLNALFYCEARSIVSSSISYTWLVNDTELSSLPYQKYTLQGLHGNLLVTGLKRHVDEAKFRCVATNGYGSIVSVVAALKVAYFEAMDSTTQVNLTKRINLSFTIPSPRTRSYPPASVTWQRLSDSLILSDGFSNGKMFISGNGDLSFVGIQDRQADTYRVTLSNPYVGKSFTQDFKITISGKLLSTSGQPFLKPIGNVTFEEGTPKVKLECIVEYDVKNGHVRPPYITWYKDGTVLNVKLSSKYEFIQGSQLKLIVKNIQLSDQGEYKCVATSWTSVATSTGSLKVTRRYDPKPIFTDQLNPSDNALPGDDVTIDAPDVSAGNISWYKDAVALATLSDNRLSKSKDGDLIIRNVTLLDTGLYQVFARTEGGEETGPPLYLHVIDKKATPVCPRITLTQTPTSINNVTPSPFNINNISSTTTPLDSSATTTTSPTLPIVTLRPPPSTSATQIVTMTTVTISTTTAMSTLASYASVATTSVMPPTVGWKSTQRGTKGTFVPTDGEVTGATISPKRSEDEADNGMFIWVYVGAGVVAILIFILVTLCIVRAKQAKLKRRRSVTLKMDNNQYEELEMNRRNGSPRANGVPGGRKTSSKGDKNHLLNETSDDGLYAPVQALHNMSTRSGACRGSVDVKRAQNNQGHEYEEPIKKTPRKPYSAPLPSIPTGPRIEPRPPSFHSYLELLGPDEQTGDLYAEAREGAFNLGFREPNDDVYDSACDGRVTETFRALSGLNLPHPGNEDSSQGIGGATPNRDSGVGTLNRGTRVIPLCDTACSEPLYHELEGPEIEPEGIYEYDVAEERINLRPESLYQPLLVEGRNSVAVVLGKSDVYEPLDQKERSASAPSAVVLRRAKPRRQDSMEAKRNCDEKRLSRALTDPQNLSGGCENENLYQPLNNSLDRCPLNVSKPKSSTSPSGEGKRLSNASVCHPSPTPSHRSLKESDLHAVSVSPSGSLKEGTSATPSPSRGKSGSTKSTRGHSRQNSDTHGIVTIEKPRRASTTDDLTRYQAMPRFHRRNLSDAGLCAVDLSQLHVDIDVSTISTNQSSPDDGLYMPLVKTAFNAGVRDSIYAELDEGRRERSCETEPNRESIYHSLQDQRDSIYQDIVR
ncbi:uncharacterized protein LOC5509605 [Nematostella vectensis]|uniref:uncharacterized protein LOC5509605 n=1 Tax=Nematostella vectensis TaxID=45351 RepID=UPI0020778FC4|nr:uncharacterized protein LOC5509605 [Nematostella vectensis]